MRGVEIGNYAQRQTFFDGVISGIERDEGFSRSSLLEHNIMISGHHTTRFNYVIMAPIQGGASTLIFDIKSYIILTENYSYIIALAFNSQSPENMEAIFDRVIASIVISPDSTSAQAEITPAPIPTGGGVNAGTFARLQNGMSISEVQNIIGVPHTSESTTEMFGITTTVIMWIGSDFSSITVMFTNGYATSISQMGL